MKICIEKIKKEFVIELASLSSSHHHHIHYINGDDEKSGQNFCSLSPFCGCRLILLFFWDFGIRPCYCVWQISPLTHHMVIIWFSPKKETVWLDLISVDSCQVFMFFKSVGFSIHNCKVSRVKESDLANFLIRTDWLFYSFWTNMIILLWSLFSGRRLSVHAFLLFFNFVVNITIIRLKIDGNQITRKMTDLWIFLFLTEIWNK